MNLTIRHKLALLAGVPVIGAAVLSAQIVAAAREQAKLAESLGSLESLVEASGKTTQLVHRLEQERTIALLVSGEQHRARQHSPSANAPLTDRRAALAATDQANAELTRFLSTRNEGVLPKRFGAALSESKVLLRDLQQTRQSLAASRATWEELSNYYEGLIRSLTTVVAGLTELTNDGELLRLLHSLVALLQLEARASAERALVAHVLAAGEFPPGTYRKLVTTISEQDTYTDVVEAMASLEVQRLVKSKLTAATVEPGLALRRTVLEAIDEELTLSASTWLQTTQPRVNALQSVELDLHELSRRLASEKVLATKRGVVFSTVLATTIVLFSLLLATALARGITRRLEAMRQAVARVGEGDLDTRVDTTHRDELGRLGEAFNSMIGEISQSRILLGEKARMQRDLEIATEIQRAMMPRTPTHPEFEFAGKMIPADEVGGDFYDILTNGTDLWLTIGDVCGHGIGSGLVMVMTQVAFATNFLHDPKSPPAAVWKRVNRLLCENISGRLNDNRYVTAQLLVHQGNGRFSCVGAHQSPILYRHRTGRCELVDAEGPWLGLDPDQALVPTSQLTLEPGDILCLYSDGLPETQNQSGELFDVGRLSQALESALGQPIPLKDAADEVYRKVEQFSTRREDDWTLLLVRYGQVTAQ